MRQLRQCYGLGASFFRVAAARGELTDTDMQVIDILESTEKATAGQLADRMGLSTGTCTGILNRLEKAGHIHRERDPNDGRRVIVRLTPAPGGRHEIDPPFASLEKAWGEMTARYDEEQRAFLLEFLQRSNTLARQEIARMREESVGGEGIFSAPLAALESARLVFPSGAFRLSIRADDGMDALYQARFEGTVPDVKTREGVVSIRYPRRLWVPGKEKRAAEVTLSRALPWQIIIGGGAAEVTAELGGLRLASLEIKGGLHAVSLDLPAPTGVVPLRISGGAAEVTIGRPAGVAASVHLKGWATAFVFDEQTFGAVGNDVRLQSPGFQPAAPHYAIEVASSANRLTITSG